MWWHSGGSATSFCSAIFSLFPTQGVISSYCLPTVIWLHRNTIFIISLTVTTLQILEFGLSTTAVSQCHVIISKHVTIVMCILLYLGTFRSLGRGEKVIL